MSTVKLRVTDFWRRYRKNRPALLCLLLLLFVFFIALTAFFLAPYPPLKTMVGAPFTPPFKMAEHPLGTDDVGRDILSMVIYGSRVSLIVGFSTAAIVAGIGILLGSIAGYYGGLIDNLVTGIMNISLMIPRFPLALVFISLFGNNLQNMIIVLGLTGWPRLASMLRSEFMSIREKTFVEAARAVGESDLRIIFGEILPNALYIVIVNLSITTAGAILLEASLSYLGLGDPSLVSWGMMLSNAQRFLRRGWWFSVFPGIALFVTVLAFNLVGDGLNDALNPRLKEK